MHAITRFAYLAALAALIPLPAGAGASANCLRTSLPEAPGGGLLAGARQAAEHWQPLDAATVAAAPTTGPVDPIARLRNYQDLPAAPDAALANAGPCPAGSPAS